MITINHRLRTVSEFIKPGTLADIGSDHAYLPIYAIQTNLISQAIAGEVIKGPYEAARNNVQEYELSNQIDVRLGDGLEVINHHEHLDNITICGMGGPLIAKILKEGQQKLQSKPRLILQSNIQTQSLRTLLQDINYQIIDERIMEEKGHIYEIVVAEFNQSIMPLSTKEEKFGPYLLEEKNEHFYKKWNRELEALYHIKSQLNSSTHHERLKEIDSEINLIQEVLDNEIE